MSGTAVGAPTMAVDIVLLNRASVELAYAVIAQRRLLYSRSIAEQVGFEAKVLSLYVDDLPILRRQRQEIIERRSADNPAEGVIARYLDRTWAVREGRQQAGEEGRR